MVSEDRELVERILAGDSEAFESIVRKYNRLAGAIAFGICGEFHLAEDIVQESFLKTYRALGSLKDPGKFRYWFSGLVRSKALDALRERSGKREVVLPEEMGDGLGTLTPYRAESPIEEEQLREEARKKVRDAVRELPPEDRTVITLKHMEGLSYKEIAEITGASVSSVESRLFRARLALKRKLDPTKT